MRIVVFWAWCTVRLSVVTIASLTLTTTERGEVAAKKREPYGSDHTWGALVTPMERVGVSVDHCGKDRFRALRNPAGNGKDTGGVELRGL